MRRLYAFLALVVVTGACSERETGLRGNLADLREDEPLFFWVAGGAQPAQAVWDTFAFPAVAPGAVDLRVGAGREEIARMEIRDLPAGATLSLDRVRLDRRRDRAFPGAIRLEGAEWVTVNGIRMADPARLPERVDESVRVLAISRRDDALLVRPVSGKLADLPVVLSPATQVVDEAGESASMRRVSHGDSLRVAGRITGGYLYADRITLLTRRSAAASRTTEGEDEPGESRGSERTRGGKGDDDRGRSRQGGAGIPAGHRPGPGECRDGNPNLPPGRQPPPRKC